MRAEPQGSADGRLDRRSFLEASGLGLGLAGASLQGRFWQMPTSTTRQVVLINLQGGVDSLSLLHPAGTGTGAPGSLYATYRARRPALAFDTGVHATLPVQGVPDLRWHPTASVLQREYNAGKLAVIRKVGVPIDERSHFKSRNIMSLGRADLAARTDQRGWLGRLADAGLSNRFDIVGVGTGQRVDFASNGPSPLTIARLASMESRVSGTSADHNLRRDVLRRMVEQTFTGEARITRALRPRAMPAFESAVDLRAATGNINNVGVYPAANLEPLGGSLADIARIIGSTLGTKIFYTFTDGFDTHGGQEDRVEAINRPNFSQRLALVFQALDAFITDLRSPAINAWNDTLIVIFTEFGRRNAENQTRGTDHGRGFDALVLGGAVNGGLKGRVLTAADVAAENLPVEIDFRTLFRKVLLDWLCLAPGTVQTVFDDYAPLPGEPAFAFL